MTEDIKADKGDNSIGREVLKRYFLLFLFLNQLNMNIRNADCFKL